MIIKIKDPPCFMLWRIIYHVLLDRCNTKYSIYYYLVFHKEETKVITSQIIMREKKHRGNGVSHN